MMRHTFERTTLEEMAHTIDLQGSLYLTYLVALGKEICVGSSLTIDCNAWETVMYMISEQHSER
jgi:hypothetical protein